MNGKKSEDKIARDQAFVQGVAEITEQVDVLVREHDAHVIVLLKRREDPSVSAKQARILHAQKELQRSLKTLKQEKERNKAVKERLRLFYQKHNFKKIEDLSMEELLSAKTKFEDFREKINQKRAKILASMSLSQNDNDKK